MNAAGTPPKNKISACVLLAIHFHRPISRIHRSIKPILAILPTWNNQTPLGKAEEAARLAPAGEAVGYQTAISMFTKVVLALTRILRARLDFCARFMIRDTKELVSQEQRYLCLVMSNARMS